MAKNGADQQPFPFDETLAKTLKFLPIIILSGADLVWLAISFVIVLVFILLIPVFIILSPVLIIPVLINRYVTGKHPIGGDQLVDEVRKKIVEAAGKEKTKVEKLGKEVKDKVEELVANLGGGGGSAGGYY